MILPHGTQLLRESFVIFVFAKYFLAVIASGHEMLKRSRSVHAWVGQNKGDRLVFVASIMPKSSLGAHFSIFLALVSLRYFQTHFLFFMYRLTQRS